MTSWRPPTREEFERAFPSVRGVFAAFDELGCGVNWLNIPQRDSYQVEGLSVGYAVISLSAALEGAYGFTRELGLIATPYERLHNKWFMTLKQHLSRLDDLAKKREVTGHVVLVVSGDPQEVMKVDDWTRGRPPLAIPVGSLPHNSRAAAEVFTERLRLRMYQRNVYQQQSAVQGDDFYGRAVHLERLEDAMLNRDAVLLLGLRKSGKTSLLKEAGRRFRADGNHFVYLDLEKLPAPPRETVPDLLMDLREQICFSLREVSPKVLELLGEGDPLSVSEFGRRFKRVLDSLYEAGESVVIALDEIEHLCPPDLLGDQRPELQDITQLLASLRSLVQETENFSFLLAGLSPAVVEAQMLFGLHNPIFQWASPHFVDPFSYEECEALLGGLGRRMGLRWKRAAVGAAASYSGGHAFLLRQLAAEVASQFDATSDSRTVNASNVKDALPDWEARARPLVDDAIHHLARYYASEHTFLQRAVETSKGEQVKVTDVDRWLSASKVSRLIGMGLLTVDRDASTYRTADFLNRATW